MAHLAPDPKFRRFDANGDPLAGGKLYSYAAGTSTPLATYVDKAGVTQNTNPVILDANGEADVWLGPLVYKLVLKDANDVVQWTVDNISTLNANTITTAMLQDGILTADVAGRAKMADGYVNAAKLATDSVETAKIKDANVTAAKLATNSVETLKIVDGAVTWAKTTAKTTGTSASSGSVGISSSSSTFSTSSTTLVDVTNLSVAITTRGGPVEMYLISADTGTNGYIMGEATNDFPGYRLAFVRDSTIVAQYSMTGSKSSAGGYSGRCAHPASSFKHIDVPSTGSYTYKVQIMMSSTSSTAYAYNCKLVVREL